MRCYRGLGRHAEGLSAYRRLRQTLSVVLGIAPSEHTQALARALQGAGHDATADASARTVSRDDRNARLPANP
jgi:DNA-binding SARP family transcriptional activator